MLEGSIKTAIPWELGDVGEQFRRSVLAGLENQKSFVSRRLASAKLKVAGREKLIAELTDKPAGSRDFRRHLARRREAVLSLPRRRRGSLKELPPNPDDLSER